MMFSQILRNLRDAGNPVRIALSSGVVLDARLASVEDDCLMTEAGQFIPFAAIDAIQDNLDDGEEFDPSDPCCQDCPERAECENQHG